MTHLEHQIQRYVRECGEREDIPRVEELASSLEMDERTLRRRCRMELSRSPKEVIIEAQLRMADYLLRNTSLSTARIAYRSGFGTRRSLFRVYRERRGCTPGAIRDS